MHTHPMPGMIALVSHGQTCCIGMNLDQAAIVDPERWMACMRESFEEILALAEPATPKPRPI